MKIKIAFIAILITIPVIGMEMPPKRIKRGPEAITEPEPKLQKLLWHNIDNWLMRFREPERLEQFAQVIKQSPSFNFWSWNNDVKVANVPIPNPETSEAWNTMRQVLINQMNAASQQLKIHLAQLALANQGNFGTGSLISYYATVLAYQPNNNNLANLLNPIIAVLISQANEETQFEALYMIIKLGNRNPDAMFDALPILVKDGINLLAKDRYGKTILDYLDNQQIPLTRNFPIGSLNQYLSRVRFGIRP